MPKNESGKWKVKVEKSKINDEKWIFVVENVLIGFGLLQVRYSWTKLNNCVPD